MKRIWNALRYGDIETKKCIGSVIIFSVLAAGLIIVAGVTSHFSMFILGMLAGTVAIIISQTFTLVDDDFVAEVDPEGTKDTVRSVSVKKMDGSTDKAKQQNNQKNRKKTEADYLQEEQSLVENDDTEREYVNHEEDNPERFSHYNEVVLKRIRKKYRVKKDHRPIIIDNSKSYHIKQCPAFIWRIHNKVYLLLLEKEPRKISISRDLIRHMDYVPGVRADRSKEYLAFKKENLITKVFEEYLPDYFDFNSKEKNTKSKCKNLYMIYPDIQVSNRSAADVLELLCLNFMPDNKITKSDRINGFFKRIYSAHILYKDHVYSITEYKENVEKVLGEMCYAEMPEWEFSLTLENLVNGRLISQQYADYYIELKSKITQKRKV